jgi:sulfite reductase (ferredoxin)
MDVTWKDRLGGRIAEDLAREIDIFETQIDLRKRGKIEEKLFAETRLRRGVYGQRYDNGQRHDGEKTQNLVYPGTEFTKGPATLWHAPGMMRIKIPYGRLTPEQLDVLGELAEEYSDAILHVTTRQDVQLHFVHIEDTPDLMRRLAAVGITTREACGNSVRNVTACPLAGVCPTEPFDVTPHAEALARFLLGHDDTQDFGRKFKVAFSGCREEACGLTNFHDVGAIARTRPIDGRQRRGFELYVGGGLGSVPAPAVLFDEFLPEEELLPVCQAIARVFGRLGEKENRAKARLKFLVKKLGTTEFKRLVNEERAHLRVDPRWTSHLADLESEPERPGRTAPQAEGQVTAEFSRWKRHNVLAQRQAGHAVAVVTLPLGDLSSRQARALADICRAFQVDTVRLTADQNIVVRWLGEGDLPAFHAALVSAKLDAPGAGTITDITACPGTDTCKLGISSSRALATKLRADLIQLGLHEDDRARSLHIKTSGCFNSCGQHHVADLGFLGVSRNVNGRRVPHFQLVIGGQWARNGGSFGLAIGAIPSKRVPEFVRRIAATYAEQKQEDESLSAFVNRIGKKAIRAMVEELQVVPRYDQDPSFYSDWGDPREYTIDDMGVGECAGEVVPYVQMGLAAAEREIFEAQLLLDGRQVDKAGRRAYSAMLQAARALTRERSPNLGTAAGEIIEGFRTHLYDTKDFFDPYAGGKFAQYLFRIHEHGGQADSAEAAHQLIEEAQLFVDAAHQCHARLGASLGRPASPAPGGFPSVHEKTTA